MPQASACFLGDLHRLMDYYRKEWNLTYSEAVGCLELIKHEILHEVLSNEDDGDDGDEEEESYASDLP